MSAKLKLTATDIRGIEGLPGAEAWYYENKGSIQVVVRVPKADTACAVTLMFRIKRAGLADWIKRTAKDPTP